MSEINNIQPLESMIGTKVIITPQSLLNRKRLYTTQNWVDMSKLQMALQGNPDIAVEPPAGWISYENGDLCYIVGDGNHRIAVGAINRDSLPFLIHGIWDPSKTRYGFNNIIQKIKSEFHDL